MTLAARQIVAAAGGKVSAIRNPHGVALTLPRSAT